MAAPSLRDYIHAPTNEMTAIYEAVDRALAPWNAGKIRGYVHVQLSHPDELWLETELLPSLRFVYAIYPADMLRLTQHEISAGIAKAAFRFFRNRTALPIDDHIVLGED